jgi:hypothetical protein
MSFYLYALLPSGKMKLFDPNNVRLTSQPSKRRSVMGRSEGGIAAKKCLQKQRKEMKISPSIYD